MKMTLDAAAAGPNYRNAHYLAVASDIAYENDRGPQRFQETLGLKAALIASANAQVYLAQDDANIVLAFRGSERPNTSEGFKDWLFTNSEIVLRPPPAGLAWADGLAAAGAAATFHNGFMKALGFLWDDLVQGTRAALQAKPRPVWCTGHSLGGALATLAALALTRQHNDEVPVEQVYTFAAPLAGNRAAAEGISSEFRNRFFRFVNANDLVPALPRNRLLDNEYRHAGTPEGLADPDTALSSVDLLLKTLMALTALSDGDHLFKPAGLRTELDRRLDAHSIEKGYIRRIEDRRKLDGDV